MGSINWFLAQVENVLQFQLLTLGDSKVTIWSLLQLCVLSAVVIKFAPKLNVHLLKRLSKRISIPTDVRRVVIKVSRWLLILLGFVLVLRLAGLDHWVFAQLGLIYKTTQSVLDLKLFKLGHTQLTLWGIVYLLALSWLLVRATAQLHSWIEDWLKAKTKLDFGVRRGMGNFVHYGLLFVGLVVLLQTAGIDLSGLTVLVGALGIGISFGLQTITNNFISGLIILFERPIKIGDRIQVGDVTGTITNISLRATTVLTDEHIAIIVPNSQFVTSNIVNWSWPDRIVGLKFRASVSSQADPETMQKMLLQLVQSQRGVLKEPAPDVLFEELSNSSMTFALCVWTRDFLERPDLLRSELNFAISRKLRGEKVEVQFPHSTGYAIRAEPAKSASAEAH